MSKNPEVKEFTSAPAVHDWEAQGDFPEPGYRVLARMALRSRALRGSVLGVVLTGALAAWAAVEDSGEYTSAYPSKDPGAQIDDEMRFGSWNMHGEASKRAGQIARLAVSHNLDALALQEVNGNSVKKLRRAMPEWYINFVMADGTQDPLKGGLGNALITRKKPRDIQTKVFEGKSVIENAVQTVTGAGEDLAEVNLSLPQARNGMQENRAAIAETIDMMHDGKKIPVRIMTTHIAGPVDPEVHQKQTNEMLKFVKDNTQEGRASIICGDFNNDYAGVMPKMTNIRFITTLDKINTSLNGKGRKIDYCSYHEANKLGLGKVTVLRNPKTDHRPIIGSWRGHIDLASAQ